EKRTDLDVWRFTLWKLIEETPHLDWLLLTKRPQNARQMIPESWLPEWPDNVWFGTTAEDRKRLNERAPHVIESGAVVTFLSCEPLLESLLPDITPYLRGRAGIDWVIVGGESGGRARPFHVQWGVELVRQCWEYDVACFFKQMGSHVLDTALDMPVPYDAR